MKSHVKDELLVSSSGESGSEDDEEAYKLTSEVEKEFFKTLSSIKSKDPKIYQKDVEFFKNVPIPEEMPKEKQKAAPLTIREYERKLFLEKGGELSDEEPPPKRRGEMSYVEEQKALKNSIKNLLQSDSEYESEAEWGGLFKKRQKTKIEKDEEEDDYKVWLKGQKSDVPDEEAAKEMKPLRDFWTNPELNQEDQFLRDYLLNKKFLETENENVVKDEPQSDSENEDQSNKIHSHRFEDPDQEFIKRYPRVMENSVRRKDDSRRRKREEVKLRKQKEKEKKKAEVKQKQNSKRKEIEQKLEELKMLTGNDKLAFENVMNKDFDIDEHDKAMQRLFNEEFYSQDDPNFNPNVETEDTWKDEDEVEDVKEVDDYTDNYNEPQCEDPDFIMDCDYDPASESTEKKNSRSKRRKDKHRRTTVSEAVKREKPVFDPTAHKSFQEYVDQYYAMDCEDFIGDLPCRFKYRRTVPNSYGLTVEEILAADPKELERWCSLRRVIQLKPEFKEKGDAKSFKRRAANEELKRKILPSLYKTPGSEDNPSNEDEEEIDESNSINIENNDTTKNKLLKQVKTGNTVSGKPDLIKKRKLVASEMIVAPNKRRKCVPGQRKSPKSHKSNENINKNKGVNVKGDSKKSSLIEMSDARLQAYGIKPKKFRNKLKYSGTEGGKNNFRNRRADIDSKKVKRKGNKGSKPSGSSKSEQSQKITKKKNIKLKEKNSSGWVVSNA